MNALNTKHKRALPATSNIVTLVAIAFTLFILTLLFLFYNNSQYLLELEHLANSSKTGSKKMQLFSEFAELARGRSRLTLQILESEDTFEQDELNQTLEGFAGQFALVREQLDKMVFSEKDRILYDTAFEWVPKILPAQRQAVELLIAEDNKIEARRLIYEVVLPGQQTVIDIFSKLLKREQQYIQQNSLNVEKSVLSINKRNNWVYGFVLIVTSALSLILIFRIQRVQAQLRSSYETLESKVESRTRDLELARDEALNANKAKSEFLSSMSHELRTPLNAILGFSQLLEMDELDTEQKDSVGEIYRAGTHLLALINEILDLAKIEAGRMTITMEEVEIVSVLNEVSALIKPVAKLHNIAVTCDRTVAPTIHADVTRLKQVLINLISNAIKYNAENGSVHVSYKTIANNQLQINIVDTGKGIPESLQAGLFEPFNRLGAEASEIEGSGIGLMITRQLIDMMDGELGFDTVVGEGTHFWIRLKIYSEHL